MAKEINFEMHPTTDFYAGFQCCICGGYTDNEGVLCRATTEEGETLIACKQCGATREHVDQELEATVARLEDAARRGIQQESLMSLREEIYA